jgi:catechol 2,3-dioxygenase-like lactoylglutathione lyase family enzyme
MTTTIAMLTLDCAEVTPAADFWKAALGYEQVAGDGENYAMLQAPDKATAGPALGLGKVEDYQPPAWPNPHGSKQFHLDLAAEDIDAETERLVGLGATLADPQPGETWRVLLDPAGHPFCVTNAANWG